MKINRIIVEGADQQGKTTLCNFLSENLGWPVIHYGPPKEGFNFHSDYFFDEYTISDRNFISEICYERTKGKNHRIKNVLSLQRDMYGTLVVYVDRFENYAYEKRAEEFSKEFINMVRQKYRKVIPRINLPVIIVKTGDTAFEVLLERIKQCI